MGSFSIAHWLVVVVVLLLIFGPKRLSEVGKGLGQGIRNFKKGLDGSEKPEGDDADQPPAKQLKAGSKKSAEVEDDEEEEEAPRPKKTTSQKRAEREAD